MPSRKGVYIILAALLFAVLAPASTAARGEAFIAKLKYSPAPFHLVSGTQLKSLESSGLLAWYEPDAGMTLLEGEVSPDYAEDKWDLTMVRADAAFSRDALGQGVRIGILDSGVNPVPELAESLLPGHNYMDGADPEDTADNYGHGTLVAGLIAGIGKDGCLGPAPGAELVPLKVTDGKAVTVSTVCKAIYGAIDDYGCQILNLSLGITKEHKSLEEAIAYAESKGVAVVSALANNGTEALNYPAAYDSVMGVVSVDRSKAAYRRNNFNGSVFLAAPGVNVKTLGHLGGYVTATGNSFAVPYVTAAAAILLGLEPELKPGEIMELLAASAEDRGTAGWDDKYGYGLLNIEGALAALAERGRDPETPCRFLSGTQLQNDSGEELRCTYLLAEYDAEGKCLSVRSWVFTLAPGATAELASPEENARYRQYVFETETMKPLAEARDIRYNMP